jgi:hypothetical protein
LPDLNPTALDLLAGSSLAEEADAHDALNGDPQAFQSSSVITLTTLMEMADRNERVTQLQRGDGPIPFSLAKAYMSMLHHRQMAGRPHAVSLRAVAAGSDGIRLRKIGRHALEIKQSSDALFIVLNLDAATSGDAAAHPTALDLVGSTGDVLSLDLPAPIGSIIQMGLPIGDGQAQTFQRLIDDPATLIQLST